MLNPRLLLVAVIWGINFAAVKYALADFYPLSFTVVRFALSSLFLVVVMIAAREPFGLDRRDIRAMVMLGFIGIMMYNLLFMYGLHFTSATNSALFISASPLFAALIVSSGRGQRITARTWKGLLLSMLGAFLILGSKPGGITFSRRDLLGDLLTLIAAAFWALYTVRADPLLKKYSPVKVTAYSMASGTVFLIPVSAYEVAHQSWKAISLSAWAAFAFSTFLSGGVAFTLWYDGVKKIGVTKTVVYHYLVPFVAVIFAALFLSERLTLSQIAGGALILTGVFLVETKSPANPKS